LSTIAVIGGGAWGTALAIALGRKQTHAIRLWVYEPEVCECINRKRENEAFLAGCEIPPSVMVSGPSFAKEVARGDPTAITVASSDTELACTVQREFSSSRFRVYTNSDVVGVELGGALKNVIAIAAGVCDGLGLGIWC
jgi:glycerol-3-phosphate dehydrogenase